MYSVYIAITFRLYLKINLEKRSVPFALCVGIVQIRSSFSRHPACSSGLNGWILIRLNSIK